MTMNKWDNFDNWWLVLPPSRPSVVELQRIKSFVQPFSKTIPVGILGSTPEYRDLLYELGFSNIYIFDKSTKYNNQMNSIRAYSNNEHFVEGDWLDTLKDYKNTFQFILSDLTIGNIAYEQRELFYSDIYESLLAQGLFFDKILTHPIENLNLKELNAKYNHLPINLETINYFSCEYIFCSELLNIKQIIDTNLFYNVLKKEFEHNEKLTKLSLLSEKMITPRNGIWYYGKCWNDVKKTYCKKFADRIEYPDAEYSPYFKRLIHSINQK